jgi:hypothetical protein
MAGSKPSPPRKDPRSADERRASVLVDFLLRGKKALDRSFYDMGLALRELAEGRLYKTLGFPSLGAMLLATEIATRREAAQLIAIVDHLPRRKATAIGFAEASAVAEAARRERLGRRPRSESVGSSREDRKGTTPPPKPSKAPAEHTERRAAAEAAALSRALGRTFRRLGMAGTIGEAVLRPEMGWVVRFVLPLDSARALATKLEA